MTLHPTEHPTEGYQKIEFDYNTYSAHCNTGSARSMRVVEAERRPPPPECWDPKSLLKNVCHLTGDLKNEWDLD